MIAESAHELSGAEHPRHGLHSEAGCAEQPLDPWAGDRELAARCVAGDRVARDELYRAHVDGIYRRMRRLVLRADLDIEDLVQQTFLEAYRSLPRYRGRAALATWLHRIAINLALSSLRRSRRRGQPAAPESIDELVDPSASPDDIVARAELVRAALLDLEALKPMHRVALILRHVEGLSVEEIAELTGANAPAVRQRIRKAERVLAERAARRDRRGDGT